MNCAIALKGETQKNAHPDKVVEYLDSAKRVSVASSYSAFFTNQYNFQCGPVTSCSIKVQGCGSAYGGSNLVINSAGLITSNQNVDAGFIETVCVECQNTAGSKVTQDNWKVT
jgi:hypothetical protein